MSLAAGFGLGIPRHEPWLSVGASLGKSRGASLAVTLALGLGTSMLFLGPL